MAGGRVLEEHVGRLAAPLQAFIELRGRLAEAAGLQIEATEQQVSKPGVMTFLRVAKGFERL